MNVACFARPVANPAAKLPAVEDIRLDDVNTVGSLVDAMERGGGFTAKKVGLALDLWHRMAVDKECTRILSFPADIMATGTRGVLVELVKRKWFDAVITTCGTLDHDLARLWGDYHHGTFSADDRELHERGIHRLGNIFVPQDVYGPLLESNLQPILREVAKDRMEWTVPELVWAVGERIANHPRAEESLIHWATKNRIPVFVPGPTDGAFGSQLWFFRQRNNKFRLDVLAEEQLLSDVVFGAKNLGALMIGGGISKHHVIWWAQFHDGLDYAIYLTTAQEFDGSLSGARLREAVSWGKVKEKASYVTVEGDATITLPLLAAALTQRLASKRRPTTRAIAEE
jgi:deoxyhypusine synthase